MTGALVLLILAGAMVVGEIGALTQSQHDTGVTLNIVFKVLLLTLIGFAGAAIWQ